LSADGRAAYVIADLVAFSTHCAQLTADGGRRGADRVSQFIDATLRPLFEAVAESGGRALNMAGDSLHAVWPILPGESVRDAEEKAKLLIARLGTGASGRTAAVRIGLGVGDVALGSIGDAGTVQLVGGDALRLAIAALQRAPTDGISTEAMSASKGAIGVQTLFASAPRPFGFAAIDTSALGVDGEARVLTAMNARILPPEEALIREPAELGVMLDAVRDALGAFCDAIDAPHLDEKGLYVMGLFGLGGRGAKTAFQAVAAIQDAMAPFGREPAIGISTGRVFAGPLGHFAPDRRLVHGTPMVHAARLMAAAQGQAVLDTASATIAERAGWAVGRLQHVAAKGEVTQIPAYGLTGRTASRVASAGSGHALVGRAGELARIASFCTATDGPRGLVIEGTVGMGKTALLDAAETKLRDTGARVVRLTPELGTARRAAEAWLGALDLAGTADAGADVDSASAVVLAMLAERPTVVLIDDAHWLDELSTIVLRRAWRGVAGLRAVIALDPHNRRDSETWLRALFLESEHRIRLGPLTLSETERLIAVRHGVERCDRTELEMFHAMCGGSPEAVIELGESWKEGLRPHARRASETATRPELDEVELPVTLAQSIERRIARLAREERRVLQFASAIGRSFDIETLVAISAGGSDKVTKALALAASCGLVAPMRDVGSRSHAFRSQAIWTATYGMMAEAEAHEAHARIAGAVLEKEPNSPASAAKLAFHFARAGARRPAARWYGRAGAEALALGAFGAALKSLERALEFDGRLRDETGAGVAGELRRSRWREQAAIAAIGLGDLKRGLHHVAAGLLALGDDTLAGRRRLGLRATGAGAKMVWRAFGEGRDRPMRRRLRERVATLGRLYALATDAYYFMGKAGAMTACATLGSERLWRADEERAAARPFATLSLVLGTLRARRLALRILEWRLARAREAADAEGEAYILGARAIVFLTGAELEAARRDAAAALAASKARGDPYQLGLQRTVLGLVLHHGGDHAAARELFLELVDASRAKANDQHLAWGLYAAAAASLPLGRVAEAEALLHEAEALVGLIDDRHSVLNVTAIRAASALEAGDTERALELARHAGSLALATPLNNFGSFEGYLAPVEVLLSIATTAGSGEVAKALAAEARPLLKRAGSFAAIYRYAATRVAQQEGVLMLLRGDRRGAAARFAHARAAAWRSGMKHEVHRAEAMLSVLDRQTVDAAQAGLTGLASRDIIHLTPEGTKR
jgi:hypothetical protein